MLLKYERMELVGVLSEEELSFTGWMDGWMNGWMDGWMEVGKDE